MEQIALIVGCFIVPLCGVLINLILRHTAKAPTTAGADLILFLVILDATVLIAHEEFSLLIQNLQLRNQLTPIFVGMVFVGLLMWMINVLYLERRVNQSFNYKSGAYSNYPLRWVITSWSLVLALSMAHFLIFTYKASNA